MANKRSRKRSNPKLIIAVAVIVAVIVIAIIVLWCVKPQLFHKYLGVGEHEWSEWQVTEADCTTNGSKKRECKTCGEQQTDVIKAIGHDWTDWNTDEEADCGNEGSKSRKCNVCDTEDTDVIPATGDHDWTDWEEYKKADCGKNGGNSRECNTCGEVETQVIFATGNHDLGDDGLCKVCGYDGSKPSEEEVAQSSLSIHFLELGNKYTGDCTLIKYGNTEVLIDAGSRQNSAATIKSYVDKYCTDGVLEYVIATHGHQDHIAGFVGNSAKDGRTGILYQYKVGTLIQFNGTNSNTQIYKNYLAAVEYAKSQGAAVYTAKQCWYETDGAKKTYYLDDEQKVSLNILYQKFYEQSTSDENDYSVCTLLTQVTENNTYNYLFTGDLEAEGESSLVENNILPEVELFKGGHHGSYTASTDKLLSVIKPKNVAVCCCCGTTEYTTNPANTFPAQAFLDRVAKYTENIYCTTLMIDYKSGKYESMNGNIVFYVLNGKLKLWCSNNDTILKDTEWFNANRVWNP